MLLESLKTIYPVGYTVKFVDLPPDGDVVLLNANNMTYYADSLSGELDTYECDIQVYARIAPKKDVYNTTVRDLNSFYSALKGYEGRFLNAVYVNKVGKSSILYIGRDKKDNMLFSLNFKMNYNY